MYGFKCPRCKTEVTIENRFHLCERRMPTAYMPNIGRVTKQVDPDYRKRFGSRPRKRGEA